MKISFIPLKNLRNKPYSTIIGYPKATKNQIERRIKELEKLRVKSVAFYGPSTVNNLQILGKGYVGIVVLAKRGTKIIALKIRRTDSQRKEMNRESELLKIANSVNVGPKLIDVSKNFVLMEYLEGEKIGNWIKELNGKGSTKKVKHVIKRVLEDCFRLDQIGLDHGELSSISKHLIVNKEKVTMIDFESSSTKRHVSNVTSATQAIFIASGIAKKVHRIYKIPSKQKIINVLRQYKGEPTREKFEGVLKILRI
ncbi:MAG: RIO1 family regulatory kinase/ATPase [Nitrosopumilaceae archaeon]|nr:RIO1 family regulatory kinase/ATPase [Nitrosopumilaceae archaeon]